MGNIVKKLCPNIENVELTELSYERSTDNIYSACVYNDFKTVKRLLETMTIVEINQKNENGDTALHLATRYGHTNIIQLLLEKCAWRSIRNANGITAFEEIVKPKPVLDEFNDEDVARYENEELQYETAKRVFERVGVHNRFIGDCAVSWKYNEDEQLSLLKRFLLMHEFGIKLDQFIDSIIAIEKNYIDKELGDIKGYEIIKSFFAMAVKERNFVYILKALTAETDFLKILNVNLILYEEEDHVNACNITRLASMISYSTPKQFYQEMDKIIIKFYKQQDHLYRVAKCIPAIILQVERQFFFTGQTFGVMKIMEKDRESYSIGTSIYTRTFLSTSKNRDYIQNIGLNYDPAPEVIITICTYIVKKVNTPIALDLEYISEYSFENEVLIVPYTRFIINNITPSDVIDGILDIVLESVG
ncbi:unnamed protein product [Didymodactylos carnosus]|uniref:Ankyrin repeat protein n=1 Tax=Didymodactylos carnosus TaxID=1234261 RepID=A0A815S923_9BILA|nr:unnamed protein product [Didymodactylos carnosus]CAF1485863.1 unnamed protein product [Didymodactylos carnosus]CAF4007407.1 unnamed protein product [Didymodactylos carnosus]CAF4349955.1 unnamed protein product [Didymodactylos carnosus]